MAHIPADLVSAFNKQDADGDGQISLREFVWVINHFYTSVDLDVAKNAFGAACAAFSVLSSVESRINFKQFEHAIHVLDPIWDIF